MAEWREDRKRSQTASLHRAMVVKRSALATWRMFACEVASDKLRVSKANDFHRSKVVTAAVRGDFNPRIEGTETECNGSGQAPC